MTAPSTDASLHEAVEHLADEFDRRQSRNAAHNGNVSCSVWGIAGAEVRRLLSASEADRATAGERCVCIEPTTYEDDDGVMRCWDCSLPATPPADDTNREG